jgi:hypothetical protein
MVVADNDGVGRGGYAIATKDVWSLECWDIDICNRFLSAVPFRQPEKKARARILLNDYHGTLWVDIHGAAATLRSGIKDDILRYRLLAEALVKEGGDVSLGAE